MKCEICKINDAMRDDEICESCDQKAIDFANRHPFINWIRCNIIHI